MQAVDWSGGKCRETDSLVTTLAIHKLKPPPELDAKFKREIQNPKLSQEIKAEVELTKEKIKNMTTYSSAEIVAAQEAEIKVEQEEERLQQLR